MTKNSKGVLGQIEGLKESFEAVLRKRTIYRQQINQLTACLRERNREIDELKRAVRDFKSVNEGLNVFVEDQSDTIGKHITIINDLMKSRDDWRDKARALAAELHERGGNGETVEDLEQTVPTFVEINGPVKVGTRLAVEEPFEPDQDLQARMGGV